jgi:ketosteroid isomerase-like protein
LFTAYAANDRDGIASVLAEEIEWTIPATIPCPDQARD